MDLVEISPNAEPPVAKIIDWGKYQYQKIKEQQRTKRNSHQADLKQIKLGIKIGQNDLDIKMKKIRKFLANGDKVKIMVVLKGREMAHQDIGMDMLNKLVEQLAEDAIAESKPSIAGRNISTTLRSK